MSFLIPGGNTMGSPGKTSWILATSLISYFRVNGREGVGCGVPSSRLAGTDHFLSRNGFAPMMQLLPLGSEEGG